MHLVARHHVEQLIAALLVAPLEQRVLKRPRLHLGADDRKVGEPKVLIVLRVGCHEGLFRGLQRLQQFTRNRLARTRDRKLRLEVNVDTHAADGDRRVELDERVQLGFAGTQRHGVCVAGRLDAGESVARLEGLAYRVLDDQPQRQFRVPPRDKRVTCPEDELEDVCHLADPCGETSQFF